MIRTVIVIVALLAAGTALAQSPATSDKADALAAAARKGDAATVKQLLDEGVDVNTKYRYGATALSYACDRGHVDVVKLLLDRGADANVKDTFYGATPLTWAVSPAMDRTPQHAEVVRLLLQHGANGKEQALIGAVSAGGLPAGALSDALQSATNARQQELVEMLGRAGAKPRVEFAIEPAQLARFAGGYSGTGSMAQAMLAITTADGRLVATLGGQRFTLVARDATTFGVVEQPGTVLTFRLEQDKPVAVTIGTAGGAILFTRAEEK